MGNHNHRNLGGVIVYTCPNTAIAGLAHLVSKTTHTKKYEYDKNILPELENKKCIYLGFSWSRPFYASEEITN